MPEVRRPIGEAEPVDEDLAALADLLGAVSPEVAVWLTDRYRAAAPRVGARNAEALLRLLCSDAADGWGLDMPERAAAAAMHRTAWPASPVPLAWLSGEAYVAALDAERERERVRLAMRRHRDSDPETKKDAGHHDD